MFTKYVYTALLALLLVPVAAGAWTVDDLQRSAATQRHLVRDYQAALDQQRQQVRRQQGEFMPSVELYYQANQRRDATATQPRESHSRGAQLSWNLFNGFGDYYRLLSSQQQQRVSDLQLQEIQQSVQQQVAQTCLRLHQQQQKLQVAQRAVQLYQQEWHNAQAKFSVGLLTRNDVLKIEVELENARLDVNRAQTIIQQQLAELQRQTLADVQLETLDLAAFDLLPQPIALASLQQQLQQSNRELQSLKTLIEVSQHERAASRSPFLPKADVVANYARGEDELWLEEGGDRDEELTAQLRLSINLFDGLRDEATQQQARIEQRRASYRYQEREHELQTELANARRDFDLAINNLQVAETNSQQAEENLRITRLAFDQGLTTSAELLDAIFFQTRADLNIIEARSAIFSAHFIIEQLTGAYTYYPIAN